MNKRDDQLDDELKNTLSYIDITPMDAEVKRRAIATARAQFEVFQLEKKGQKAWKLKGLFRWLRLIVGSERDNGRRIMSFSQKFLYGGITVAVGIVAVGLIGPSQMMQLGAHDLKTALVQIKDLEQALKMYELDVGRYPSSSEGLDALVDKPGSADGWNGP